MQLINTKNFMANGLETGLFASYAVLVSLNGDEKLITSNNVNDETYFDVASMGKVLITSTLILKSIGEKRLSLDNTLETFFENVPDDKKRITIKHLLTHTSGLVRKEFSAEVYARNNDYIAEKIIAEPLKFAPGTDYTYSCSGFMLLGFILEKIYDCTLDEIFYLKLKHPLGLTRSRFNIAIDEKNAVNNCHRKEMGLRRMDDNIVVNMRNGVAGNGGSFWGLCDIKNLCNLLWIKTKHFILKSFLLRQKQTTHPILLRGVGWDI